MKPDYAKNSIIDFHFNSRNTSGTPISFVDSPTIAIYKGNSNIESATDITFTTDFDSRVGFHHVRIQTSGSFFDHNEDYTVIITSGTVDGINVSNEKIFEFSIDKQNVSIINSGELWYNNTVTNINNSKNTILNSGEFWKTADVSNVSTFNPYTEKVVISGNINTFDQANNELLSSGNLWKINYNTVAETILKYDFSNVVGEASRSLINAARFIRNKWYPSSNILYVTKENDSDIAWSGELSFGNGSGVAGMDPF